MNQISSFDYPTGEHDGSKFSLLFDQENVIIPRKSEDEMFRVNLSPTDFNDEDCTKIVPTAIHALSEESRRDIRINLIGECTKLAFEIDDESAPSHESCHSEAVMHEEIVPAELDSMISEYDDHIDDTNSEGCTGIEMRRKRRREFHKIHTRRSRAKLNSRMDELKEILPNPPNGVVIKSKAQIIEYAIYILKKLLDLD